MASYSYLHRTHTCCTSLPSSAISLHHVGNPLVPSLLRHDYSCNSSTAPPPLIPRQHSPLLGSRCLSTLIDPPSSGMILTHASLPTIFSYILFLSPLVQLHPAVCQVSWPYHATNHTPRTHSCHHILIIPLLILFPFLTFSLYLYFPLPSALHLGRRVRLTPNVVCQASPFAAAISTTCFPSPLKEKKS
jgi:hypothetical protein